MGKTQQGVGKAGTFDRGFDKGDAMESFKTLLQEATKLPDLSFSMYDDSEETDPLEILHRRFDAITLKLEALERKISAMKCRPANVVPLTGAVAGLAKYCRQLKVQRDRQENINYVCYLHAYQYVYNHLSRIAEHATELLQAGVIPPTLTNSTSM